MIDLILIEKILEFIYLEIKYYL